MILRKRLTIQDVMAKQHENLPNVHASQILDVWDATEDMASLRFISTGDCAMEKTIGNLWPSHDSTGLVLGNQRKLMVLRRFS